MRSLSFALLAALALPPLGLGDVQRGNRYYREGRYAEAVEAYRTALEDGRESPQLHYNLGTALLKLGRYAEAERHLREALRAVEPELRRRAFYNLGNRYLLEARNGQGGPPEARARLLDGAVDAYKRALRLNPADRDAKWNLELALRDRDEQRRSAAGQRNQEQQQPQGGAGSGGLRQPPGPSPGGGGAASPGAAQAPPAMSREKAERILGAAGQDERELFRSRLRRGSARETPVLRDW